jgi:hypothetical protein
VGILLIFAYMFVSVIVYFVLIFLGYITSLQFFEGDFFAVYLVLFIIIGCLVYISSQIKELIDLAEKKQGNRKK